MTAFPCFQPLLAAALLLWLSPTGVVSAAIACGVAGSAGDRAGERHAPSSPVSAPEDTTPRAAGEPEQEAAAPAPTFTRDIAPILYDNCAVCHRPGESAPFSLLTYADARKRAWQMGLVTESRFMPPWKPEAGYGRFAGARRLTDEQIATIRRWEKAGAPEGPAESLPPLPRFAAGWLLGKPDLVIRMAEAFVLGPDGTDVYRNFLLPIPVERRRFVRGVEFRPSNRSIVHHARMAVDRSDASRKLDARDPRPGWEEGMSFGQAQNPDGHYLGWTPGRVPHLARDDMAWRLDPGTDLVVQVHMQPTGKNEPLQVSVGFFFTETPPARIPAFFRLTSKSIDIPADERSYTIRDSFELPIDVDVLGVYPHAHYLGKSIKGWAELPDGRTEWLLWIRDWDFNWQDQYWYVEPLFLPKGTTVRMEIVYDNSEGNIRNPNHPPQRVVYGERATDEMGDLFLQVVPRNNSDLATLKRKTAERETYVSIARLEKALTENPLNTGDHQALALHYRRVGRNRKAVEHLQEATRLAPDDAAVRNNLGAALQSLGRLEDAAQAYRAALQLDPAHAEAHNNLGLILARNGRSGEAEHQFLLALESRPDYGQAHLNLGFLLARQGRTGEARRQFEVAARSAPDSAQMQNNAGVALAGLGELAAAIERYRRALALMPSSADAHDNLGTALHQLGRPREAIAHYRESLRLRPGSAATRTHLGVALAEVGDLDAAIEQFEAALALDPDHRLARRNLGTVLLKRRMESPDPIP